jgi:predicted transcriptional regulator
MLAGALGSRGLTATRLRAAGYENAEIAGRLGLSPRHVSRELGEARSAARAYVRETRNIAA